MNRIPERRTHGTGRWRPEDLAHLGQGTVLEDDVLVFHPEHVSIGDGAYVGHLAILKAYHRNELVIEDGAWLGEGVYLHAAGGIRIGRNVGIGAGVRIITSVHAEEGRKVPILHSRIEFAAVEIDDDADIGIGATILPGVRIGSGAIVGAGAVVTRDVAPFAVVAGVPARVIRMRPDEPWKGS